MNLLALILLASPVEQEVAPAPPVAAEAEASAAEKRRQEWWDSLPEEKRRELEDRRRRFEGMSEEEREAMRARMEVLRTEMDAIERGMSDEDRAKFEQLDERGKRKFLERAARGRLEERSEELKVRGVRDPKKFEEYRRRHVERAVQRAVEEGWIGSAAAAWLQTAPLHEAMVVVGDIEKWRFLARAAKEGLWEEAEVPQEVQERLLALPAPEFFRELEAHGVRGGPRERGRRGGRGRGPRDGDGRRGEGGPPGGSPPEGPPTGERGERRRRDG